MYFVIEKLVTVTDHNIITGKLTFINLFSLFLNKHHKQQLSLLIIYLSILSLLRGKVVEHNDCVSEPVSNSQNNNVFLKHFYKLH